MDGANSGEKCSDTVAMSLYGGMEGACKHVSSTRLKSVEKQIQLITPTMDLLLSLVWIVLRQTIQMFRW